MRRAAALVAVAVAVVAGVLAAAVAATARGAADDDVYRLTVTSSAAGASRNWTEWIQPSSGRWRIEQTDHAYLYTGTAYAALGAGGVYLRTGSAAFLGPFANRAQSRDALRAYLAGGSGVTVTKLPDGRAQLAFTKGATAFTAVVEETIGAADADARGLFAVPAGDVTSSATERRVGQGPAPPFVAYWLGPAYAATRAAAAVEEYSGPSPNQRAQTSPPPAATSFDVFYETAAANGRSSAVPGQRAPAGEIRVLSQPVATPFARGLLQAYNGRNGSVRTRPWPRSPVTLANGEQATVIPDRAVSMGPRRGGFAVVTKTTLVNVTGSFRLADIPAAAALLRPLAPAR